MPWQEAWKRLLRGKAQGFRFTQGKHIRMQCSALGESLPVRLQIYQFFKAVTNPGEKSPGIPSGGKGGGEIRGRSGGAPQAAVIASEKAHGHLSEKIRLCFLEQLIPEGPARDESRIAQSQAAGYPQSAKAERREHKRAAGAGKEGSKHRAQRRVVREMRRAYGAGRHTLSAEKFLQGLKPSSRDHVISFGEGAAAEPRQKKILKGPFFPSPERKGNMPSL